MNRKISASRSLRAIIFSVERQTAHGKPTLTDISKNVGKTCNCFVSLDGTGVCNINLNKLDV